MTSYAIYCLYDAGERLLYVGQSANPLMRLRQHASMQEWWRDVKTVRIDHLPDTARRGDALDAENKAIIAGRPLHNRRQSSETPKPVLSPDAPDDIELMTLGEAAELAGVSTCSLRTRVCVHDLIPRWWGADGRVRVAADDVRNLVRRGQTGAGAA